MYHFARPGVEGRGGWREVRAQCRVSVRMVFCLEAVMYFVFGMNGLLPEKRAV